MTDSSLPTLSTTERFSIVAAGFLGWLLAGVQLAVTSLVMREAIKGLLGDAKEGVYGQWYGWLVAGFLLGAAAGGYFLGWVGDRFGRRRAMAISIAWYSLFAGLTYFVREPWHLLAARTLVGIGVGGMWPNGVALVSEAWPNMSRPMLAGVIGTAANVGIMLFSILACFVHVTPDNWRWVMLLSLTPLLLALFVAMAVPESPRWLAVRRSQRQATPPSRPIDSSSITSTSPMVAIFRPPLLRVTLIGIALGTVPLFGGWGSANWANAWASQAGERQEVSDPALKARAVLARSGPGSLASLLGGALASVFGRKRSYFLLSLACLASAQYLFWFSAPGRSDFLWAVAALGLFSGFFFGWLPYCLPELFPTAVRSTGAGVSFNFGRIATAIGILVAAGMLRSMFGGDYARIGRLTSLIYVVGAVVIWYAPNSWREGLKD